MSREIPLPEIDEDIKEVTFANWLKQPGDAVSVGEIIAEVTTEKANVEIESPVAGVVEALLVELGDTVEVGQPIARLRVD